MKRDALREITAFFVLAGCVFLFISTLSYDPSYHLGGEAARNACGPAGSAVAFFLISWIGKWGSYVLAGAVSLLGIYSLMHRQIPGLGWKLVGLAILVLTFSSLEVALSSGAPTLPGGIYGQSIHAELLGKLNWFGAYLFLGFAVMVALLISTEFRFYPVLSRARHLALDGQRWRRAGSELARRARDLRLRLVPARLGRLWPSGFLNRRLSALRTRGAVAGDETSRRSRAPLSAKPERPERGDPAPGGESEDDEYEYVDVDEDAEGEDDEYEYEYEYVDVDEDAEGEDDEYEYEYEYVDVDEEDSSEGGQDGAESGAEARASGSSPGRTADDSSPFDVKIKEAADLRRSSRRQGKRSRRRGRYSLPPLELIQNPPPAVDATDRTVIQETAAKIEETLQHFKIDARVVEVQKGPVITQYEISLAAGIKVHKIVSLSDDLSMALEAESIRIVAPVPGRATVGIEVPNRTRATVSLRELLESREYRNAKAKLPLAIGKDIAGRPIIGDLAEMPHLLIAGSTGSGKSVAINTIITNLLLTRPPREVKLILLDPKMVELSSYEEIPHLLTPVVTDMKKAPAVLNWLVDKMDERYELLARAGVRHLTAYNALGRDALRERLRSRMDEEDIADIPEFLPYIIVIIDELADLMMSASKEVEGSITRLSQKSRAVGIHVVLATQRPSVDVITGLIKANMPCRVSFHVTSKVDSRTILDRNGSEKLLGKGDMLYLPPGTSNVVRAQGAFISDPEINAVVEAVRDKADPQFDEELSRFGLDGTGRGGEEDELYEEAVRTVLSSQRGSVTLLQRQLQIGYTRASRLMELMHENGLVGPFKGSKAREVFYTLEEWEAARQKS